MKRSQSIIASVCLHFNIEEGLITNSRSRKEEVALARHICQYLLHIKTDLTLESIGQLFGRKYPAVIHGIRRIKEQLSNPFDNSIKTAVKKIQQEL